METIVVGILCFALGFIVQRYLTRYREKISALAKELNDIQFLCRKACIDMENKEPCIYIKRSLEHGSILYEQDGSLHQKIKFPIIKDNELLKELNRFLRIVDSYRRVFTGVENGYCKIISHRLANGETRWVFEPAHNKKFSLLSEEERSAVLAAYAREAKEIFEKINSIIRKMLG